MSDISDFMGNPLDNGYEKYYKLVHYCIKERLSQCSKEDIEDLTSEVFRRAANRLKNGGNPIVNPKKWLSAIADSVCADYGHDSKGGAS